MKRGIGTTLYVAILNLMIISFLLGVLFVIGGMIYALLTNTFNATTLHPALNHHPLPAPTHNPFLIYTSLKQLFYEIFGYTIINALWMIIIISCVKRLWQSSISVEDYFKDFKCFWALLPFVFISMLAQGLLLYCCQHYLQTSSLMANHILGLILPSLIGAMIFSPLLLLAAFYLGATRLSVSEIFKVIFCKKDSLKSYLSIGWCLIKYLVVMLLAILLLGIVIVGIALLGKGILSLTAHNVTIRAFFMILIPTLGLIGVLGLIAFLLFWVFPFTVMSYVTIGSQVGIPMVAEYDLPQKEGCFTPNSTNQDTTNTQD